MDINWRTLQFDKKKLQGVIVNKNNGKIKIMGELKANINKNSKIIYWAATPVNMVTSFTGSGMPYANPEQAYDRSKNVGMVNCKNGKFEFSIYFPGSYYTGLGSIYVPPNIHLKLFENNSEECITYNIVLGKGIQQRQTVYNINRNCPNFYNNRSNLPFRSQEQILRDSSISTAIKQTDYWGLKPAG